MHHVPKVMSQLLVSIMFGFGLSCISVFVNWLEWWTTVSPPFHWNISTASLWLKDYTERDAGTSWKRETLWGSLKEKLKLKHMTFAPCFDIFSYFTFADAKVFFLLCRSKVQQVWLTSSTSLNWSQGCGDITVNVWRSPYSVQSQM